MREFQVGKPCFTILKHTNACGVARRHTLLEAWEAALACDPTSAFGGIFICNAPVDLATAQAINKSFTRCSLRPILSRMLWNCCAKNSAFC